MKKDHIKSRPDPKLTASQAFSLRLASQLINNARQRGIGPRGFLRALGGLLDVSSDRALGLFQAAVFLKKVSPSIVLALAMAGEIAAQNVSAASPKQSRRRSRG